MDITEGVTMGAEDVRLMWPFDIPMQMGEDLVLISPRFVSTAVPGLFSEEPAPSGGAPMASGDSDRKGDRKKKEKEKEDKKREPKGGFLKGLKKHFS